MTNKIIIKAFWSLILAKLHLKLIQCVLSLPNIFFGSLWQEKKKVWTQLSNIAYKNIVWSLIDYSVTKLSSPHQNENLPKIDRSSSDPTNPNEANTVFSGISKCIIAESE